MTFSPPRPWLASYADGVPSEIELPSGSLYDLLADSIREFPDNIALEFFGATMTYTELGVQIDRVAEGLRVLGVQPGDPVAIVLPNAPQHIVAFYAVLRLGGIVVEHNPLYTPRELRHQFEDHAARFVISWDKVVQTLRDFPADVAIDTIISVDVTRSMPFATRAMLRLPIRKARVSRASLTTKVRGALTWEELLAYEPISDRVARPAAGDVALIQYTSGTTGAPKGATLTHLNLNANAAQARAWVPLIQRGTSVVYAVLPMFHAYGLTLCLTFAISMGSRLVLFPKFDPDLVLKVLKKRPPSFLPAVPPIYQRLIAAAQDQGVSLQGIDLAISGAMPLAASLVEPWEKLTGGYLVEGYGLSETSPVLMANPVAASRRAGTVGLPLPNTEIRVVDPKNPTVDVAAGEEGELLVRGPQVFSGYWKKPDETAAVFVPAASGTDAAPGPGADADTDADTDAASAAPWLRTGDIVTMDADGFVSVVDRIKELIITGGFNVAPSEVEEMVCKFPGIAEAAVIGMPSEHSGEDVVAAIVLEPGTFIDPQAVRAFVRDRLAAYKVPKRVIVVDDLPRSLIGKVLRREVREQLVRAERLSE